MENIFIVSYTNKETGSVYQQLAFKTRREANTYVHLTNKNDVEDYTSDFGVYRLINEVSEVLGKRVEDKNIFIQVTEVEMF